MNVDRQPGSPIAVELAQQLRDVLRDCSQRLVLAESCTAGRVAATLAVLPGMSQWLCGSFVVYRSASKTAWLNVPASLLEAPGPGPVSAAASRELALAALTRTPEADWAIAVTGDVGPGAAATTDGMIFLAAAPRRPASNESPPVLQAQIRLKNPAPSDAAGIAARLLRLEEATQHVLQFAVEQIQRFSRMPL